jgi:carboxymethylenebutenolidase
VLVVHETSGLNDHIRDICRRFAEQGYAALAVDLFTGRNRAVCMARMMIGTLAGNLEYFGVPGLKAALGRLAERSEVDAGRIGAIGFCLGGSIVLTWGCTDGRLKAIAPYYGTAPRPRAAIRRLCPVVGSWPDKDFTTKAAGILETELTAAGVPHDLKVYPGTKHGPPEVTPEPLVAHPLEGAGFPTMRPTRRVPPGSETPPYSLFISGTPEARYWPGNDAAEGGGRRGPSSPAAAAYPKFVLLRVAQRQGTSIGSGHEAET